MSTNPPPELMTPAEATDADRELQHRADYITGLRQLADLLAAHPELPLPYEGDSTEMAFHFLSAQDPKAELAAAVRVLPTSFTKEVMSSRYGDYFDLKGSLTGLKIRLSAFRNDVCERVVTGTREETVEEPDPEALAKVPTIIKTVVVEDVEWVCAPILAGGAG